VTMMTRPHEWSCATPYSFTSSFSADEMVGKQCSIPHVDFIARHGGGMAVDRQRSGRLQLQASEESTE